MSAFKRWLFAVIGAAVIVTAIIGVFVFAERFGNKLNRDHCIDQGDVWDYTSKSCHS